MRRSSYQALDDVIRDALDALRRIVPFDLATVMELRGDELAVRVAHGPLSQPAVTRHRLHLDAFPSVRAVLADGRARAFTEDDHHQGDGDPFDGVLDLDHGHFCMVAPLPGSGAPLGVVTLDRADCGVFPADAVALVTVFAQLLALAIEYGDLRVRLEEQNRLLHEQVGPADEACAALEASRSGRMRQVVRLAKAVAPTDTPVLLLGETGTGKDVVANALHAWSRRGGRALVRLNCAALPAGLIESELFGHVKGAFSGASSARIGRFQAADGGTLFLDEVGELPLDLQAKLLRVLQEGTFEPVGSDRTASVDVRVVAATNRDLEAGVAAGAFRADLYYRLAVFPILLPPLRDRPEDVEVIAQGFLDRHAARTGRGPWLLTAPVLDLLTGRPWRGNVRELVNTLERVTILAPPGPLEAEAFGPPPPGEVRSSEPPVSDLCTLDEAERRHILSVLRHTGGAVYGPAGAAQILGVPGSTLASRMKRLGLGGARSHRH